MLWYSTVFNYANNYYNWKRIHICNGYDSSISDQTMWYYAKWSMTVPLHLFWIAQGCTSARHSPCSVFSYWAECTVTSAVDADQTYISYTIMASASCLIKCEDVGSRTDAKQWQFMVVIYLHSINTVFSREHNMSSSLTMQTRTGGGRMSSMLHYIKDKRSLTDQCTEV